MTSTQFSGRLVAETQALARIRSLFVPALRQNAYFAPHEEAALLIEAAR